MPVCKCPLSFKGQIRAVGVGGTLPRWGWGWVTFGVPPMFVPPRLEPPGGIMCHKVGVGVGVGAGVGVGKLQCWLAI